MSEPKTVGLGSRDEWKRATKGLYSPIAKRILIGGCSCGAAALTAKYSTRTENSTQAIVEASIVRREEPITLKRGANNLFLDLQGVVIGSFKRAASFFQHEAEINNRDALSHLSKQPLLCPKYHRWRPYILRPLRLVSLVLNNFP